MHDMAISIGNGVALHCDPTTEDGERRRRQCLCIAADRLALSWRQAADANPCTTGCACTEVAKAIQARRENKLRWCDGEVVVDNPQGRRDNMIYRGGQPRAGAVH